MKTIKCTRAQALAVSEDIGRMEGNIRRTPNGRFQVVGETRRGGKIYIRRRGCIIYFFLSGYAHDDSDIALDQ